MLSPQPNYWGDMSHPSPGFGAYAEEALNRLQVGIKILRFSTNKSLYLAKDTRQRHSYYGTLIGTRMRSIK